MSIKFLIFLLGVFGAYQIGFWVMCLYLILGVGVLLYVKDYKWRYLVFIGIVLWRLFLWGDFQDVEVDIVDNGELVEVVGDICLEPDIRRTDVRYGVCVDLMGIRRILWKNSKNEVFEFGDKLKLDCVLETPFEENGFSYKNYLSIFKVDYICEGRLVEFTEGGMSFRRGILWWKNWMIDYFDMKLLEPVSSLMNGILFGSRRGFAEDIMDQFARTGLTHIIAVSGYNVALVVLVMEFLFWWVPRNWRFYLMILSLVGFAFLTGMSASVIRACVMGGLTLWGVRAGGKASFWKILLVCIIAMGVWNPSYVYYDVSLHLSVLATVGVVMGGRMVEIGEGEDVMGLKEAFYMTIFAQVFTTPLILMKFDYFSIVSPLANVLVAPFLPILMLLGCLLLVVEVLFPFEFFRFGLVLVIEILGRVFFKIVEWVSMLDFLVLELEGVDRGLWVAVYVLVVVFVGVFLAIKYKD